MCLVRPYSPGFSKMEIRRGRRVRDKRIEVGTRQVSGNTVHVGTKINYGVIIVNRKWDLGAGRPMRIENVAAGRRMDFGAPETGEPKGSKPYKQHECGYISRPFFCLYRGFSSRLHTYTFIQDKHCVFLYVSSY